MTVRNEDTLAHTLTASDQSFSTGTIDPGAPLAVRRRSPARRERVDLGVRDN